jgi:hypothetical protein
MRSIQHGKRLWFFGAIVLIALTSQSLAEAASAIPGASAIQATDKSNQARLFEEYAKLPLSFEPNRGQTNANVKFLTHANGYTLFLAGDAAVISFNRVREIEDSHSRRAADASQTLRMILAGANSTVEAAGLDDLPGTSNYFLGNDPKNWYTGIPTFARVQYPEIYPGVDLIYYGTQRQLEYDFVVARGANPKAIHLAFEGARRIRINSEGDLVLGTQTGEVRFKKPVVYQPAGGGQQKVTIAGKYVLRNTNEVTFDIASYDHSRPLVIDPVVLVYSTYLGGPGNDVGNAIAVDGGGNAYITGSTNGGFPVTAGAFQVAYGGGASDAFVTKLNPGGAALVYSTYLGGGGNDSGNGIAVDSAGNAYVTGFTTGGFPVTAGAFQVAYGGGASDAFVTKLNAAGAALVYSTYLGGAGTDVGNSIVLDSAGDAYITGSTTGGFRVTAGAFQVAYGGGASDAFVSKLNPAGAALVYSTYLGGAGTDAGNGIAVDCAGNAYVTGSTTGAFPVTPGAFQVAFGGGATDAFVTRLNVPGAALLYSTYVGGVGNDVGNAVAVDSGGNAYITGSTTGAFPVTAGAFQVAYGGGASDAFVTTLNPAGNVLVYSTYLGGAQADVGRGVKVDSAGNAYVTGYTASPGFPLLGCFQCGYGGGASDIFISKVNPTGAALVYSSFLGGSGTDVGNGIAIDAAGSAYVAGSTTGAFPTTAGAFQVAYGGGATDAVVAKVR